MTVDRDWDVPVFVQVAGFLRDRIESGELAPRRPIPSLRSICEEYGVARATASKAIAILVSEGLIRAVRGKGMFVVDRSR